MYIVISLRWNIPCIFLTGSGLANIHFSFPHLSNRGLLATSGTQCNPSWLNVQLNLLLLPHPCFPFPYSCFSWVHVEMVGVFSSLGVSLSLLGLHIQWWGLVSKSMLFIAVFSTPEMVPWLPASTHSLQSSSGISGNHPFYFVSPWI